MEPVIRRRKPSGFRLLAVLVALIAAAFLALRAAGWWLLRRSIGEVAESMPLPASLKKPRVILDTAKVAKSRFAKVPGVGPVSDLAAVPSGLVVAGQEGVAVLDAGGRPQGEVLPVPTHVAPVSVLTNGSDWSYFSPGWTMAGPRLFDRQGKILWQSSVTVQSAAAVDWKNDGKPDFALGGFGGDGIDLKDMAGRTVWHRPAGNPWRMAVVTEEDGSKRLLHSDAGGRLVVLDRKGRSKALSFEAYVNAFAPLRNGPGVKTGGETFVLDGPPLVVIGETGHLLVAGLDGRVREKLSAPPAAPEAADAEVLAAVSVPLKEPGRYYLAVLANLGRYGERCVLYLYDQDSNLVYEELLAQHGGALAIVERKDAPNLYRLLLGGVDEVTAYDLQPTL